MRTYGDPDIDSQYQLPLESRLAWKTVNLGNYRDVHELLAALDRKGIPVDNHARALMLSPDFTLLTEPGSVQLVTATIFELTGSNSPDRQSAIEAGWKRGWLSCSHEVPAQVALQVDRLPDMRLITTMELIKDPTGLMCTINMGQGNCDIELIGHMPVEQQGDTRFVFVKS